MACTCIRTLPRSSRPVFIHSPILKKSYFIHQRRFSLESTTIGIQHYLSYCSITQLCQFSLESCHSYFGLPWWATVVGTTLAFKLLTSPMLYAAERATATHSTMKALVQQQMPNIKDEVEHFSNLYNLKDDKKRLWMQLAARKYENVLIEQLRCHPFTLLCWPLLQAPVWIGMSFAVRNLSGQNPYYFDYNDAIADELQTQGIVWFSNLAVPDQFYVLPAAVCIVYLLAPTVSSLGLPVDAGKSMFFRFSRIANVIATGFLTYIALHMPAIMPLYWTTSMFFTLLLRLILKFPLVRRKLSIAQGPYESQRPIKELILRIIGKWKTDPSVQNLSKTMSNDTKR